MDHFEEVTKLQSKVEMKIEQLARYRVAGAKDVDLCKLFNMTTPGLARILATPEYKEAEQRVFNAHLKALDGQLSARVDKIRADFRDAVPHAVASMVDIVKQRRDLRASLAAAKEILEFDPDRALTKTSKNASLEPSGPSLTPDTVSQLANEASVMSAVNFIQSTTSVSRQAAPAAQVERQVEGQRKETKEDANT